MSILSNEKYRDLQRCGYTQDMLNKLAEWCPSVEDEPEYLQEYISQGEIKKLLKELKKIGEVSFKRPLIQFLAWRFQQDIAKGLGLTVQSVESKLHEEIDNFNTPSPDTGRKPNFSAKRFPVMNKILELCLEKYIEEGAACDNTGNTVYSTLECVGQNTWNKTKLRRALFDYEESDLSESQFMMLAVMLDMPEALAKIILTKFLHRRWLQLWKLEDLLTYICFNELQLPKKALFCKEACIIYSTSTIDERKTAYKNTKDVLNDLNNAINFLEKDTGCKIWNGTILSSEFVAFLKMYKIRTAGKATQWFNPNIKQRNDGVPSGRYVRSLPVYYDKGLRAFEKMRIALLDNFNGDIQGEDKDSFDHCIYNGSIFAFGDMLKEDGRDESTFFKEERELAELLVEIFRNKTLNGTRLSRYQFKENKKSGNYEVERDDMVTMTFLYSVCVGKPLVSDCEEEKAWILIHGIQKERNEDTYIEEVGIKSQWIDGELVQPINTILNDCGYSPLYYANPYDCFIIYLLTCNDPFGTFQTLWAIQNIYTKKYKNTLLSNDIDTNTTT